MGRYVVGNSKGAMQQVLAHRQEYRPVVLVYP